MWKIGLFLIVVSISALSVKAKANGYCTGIGLNCVPVMTGHLLGLMGITAKTMTWGDGTLATWGDGTQITWSAD